MAFKKLNEQKKKISGAHQKSQTTRWTSGYFFACPS